MIKTLALKIDIDTERGTRFGVLPLVNLLKELTIPATFFFSLGPDHTGRALKRIFRRGFFTKVTRTGVISTYGVRTLLNGVLLPGPHIGKKHAKIMREVKQSGFSIGIHCYDHVRWQDGVGKMSVAAISREFQRAQDEFERIFQEPAEAAAAPGFQANAKTLAVYAAANLLYASDCRGSTPFFPKVGEKVFRTLQIPTTLPTLDELLGRPDFPLERLINYYFSLLKEDALNVLTIHAELEGRRYLDWFREFLRVLQHQGVQFCDLETIAKKYLAAPDKIPIHNLIQGEVAGRSGKLALEQET